MAEIARLLGISRQRVDVIIRTHTDFPQPEAKLSAGRVWVGDAVVTWARSADRLT